MRHNWQVKINSEGNLEIKAQGNMEAIQNLFGAKQLESGLFIYAHEMRALRNMLKSVFPQASIRNLHAIEHIIKEEFCQNRSVKTLKSLLENAEIPYRSYSNVA